MTNNNFLSRNRSTHSRSISKQPEISIDPRLISISRLTSIDIEPPEADDEFFRHSSEPSNNEPQYLDITRRYSEELSRNSTEPSISRGQFVRNRSVDSTVDAPPEYSQSLENSKRIDVSLAQ